MTARIGAEEQRLAGVLADEAVRDLPLEDEDRALLAAMLEIDLLVHPALEGVLRTESVQRTQTGPSGTLSKEPATPAMHVLGKRR